MEKVVEACKDVYQMEQCEYWEGGEQKVIFLHYHQRHDAINRSVWW